MRAQLSRDEQERPAVIAIEQFDHLGIRVTDEARALDFYKVLGFEVRHRAGFDTVTIIKNNEGVEINLIVNGVDKTGGKNILMDVPEKHPGYTHVAFRVADMKVTIAEIERAGIKITQGPATFGDGHVSIFVRDPDRNVIELRARLTEASAQEIPGLVFYDPKG
jgi:lactoylglutathione lyase